MPDPEIQRTRTERRELATWIAGMVSAFALLIGLFYREMVASAIGETGLAYVVFATLFSLVSAAVALLGAIVGLASWSRIGRWTRVVALAELALCGTIIYLLEKIVGTH